MNKTNQLQNESQHYKLGFAREAELITSFAEIYGSGWALTKEFFFFFFGHDLLVAVL